MIAAIVLTVIIIVNIKWEKEVREIKFHGKGGPSVDNFQIILERIKKHLVSSE